MSNSRKILIGVLATLFSHVFSLTSAQTFRLDFIPQTPLVRIYVDSLTAYTDTTSLFFVYEKHGTKGLEDYDKRVKRLVQRQFIMARPDTVSFVGTFVPFADNIDDDKWYVDWAIQKLTRENLLVLYDKHGQLVRTLRTKKIGTKKKGYVRRAFINTETNEELFNELLFLRTVNKDW